MEFLTKAKGYEEEEEEEEELEVVACDFFPNSHSQNQQWLEQGSNQTQNHFQNHVQAPVVDLSLRIDTSINIDNNNSSKSSGFVVEREHMFDKVVTPSDVGKLNRLVIPKQHAEKYFPLDSTTNDKGLILNFEDRNGKPWRFRYSYWNSSQSYVMTKGWSRFVKDKKLDAGDVVSFQRAVAAKDRLFIDWRRRPDAPRPLHHHHFSNPLLLLPQSLRWPSARHFTLPPPPPPPPQRRTHHHHLTNYSNLYPSYAFEMPNLGMGSNGNTTTTTTSNSMYYFRPSISTSSSSSLYRMGNGDEIVVNTEGSSMMGINKANSGGATVTATAAKRLRLFGVNMECSAAADEEEEGGGGEEDPSNGGVSRRGKEPLSLNWDFL